jgi:TonB-linked SusC/RagA family outer membrane protein
MLRFRVVLLVLSILALPAIGQAQSAVITGTVRSPTQQPVRGAFVHIPELTVSTVTNDAGFFRLAIPPANVRSQGATVRISHIGFREATINIEVRPGATSHDVTLTEVAIPLEEVIVSGTAGQLERRAQASVVQKINVEQVAQSAPVRSVANLLQSRVPGVSVQDASGTSGTAATIRIRGLSSIGLSNEPILFIDGVRSDNRSRQIYGAGGQEGSRLNDIQPEDIESIEVVKGPAAATLYGADATAGVIQIITKRGRAGGGFQQTIGFELHSLDHNWTPPANFGTCTQALITAGRALCVGQTAGAIISDNPLVRADAFRRGMLQGFTYSARGGGDRFGYFLSLNHDKEEGTLPNNEYKVFGGQFNFDFLPSQKIRLEAGVGLNRVDTDLPQNDNNIYGYIGGGLLGRPETVGTANDGWFGANRFVSAISAIENDNVTLRIRPRIAASYNPFTWFTNRLILGADLGRAEAASLFPRNDSTWYGTAELNSGQIGEARENHDRITADYLGNLTARLSEALRADISFGSQFTQIRTDLTNVTGVGLITNSARSVNAASRVLTGGQSFTESKTLGVFGQTQLGYQDRLFVQVAARLDQHSSFGEEAKPFLSPKFGISYVVTEEPTLRDVLPGLLSTLRLRASYGTTGRSPGTTDALTTFSSQAFLQPNGTTVGAGVIAGNPGNAELKPERGIEFEAGADVAFFNERLGLEVTYFNKRSLDQILNRPLPASSGFTSNPADNIGEMVNRGFEVGATAQLLTLRNLGWSVRVGFNTLHNEVTDLGEISPFNQLNRVTEGRPAYGFHSRKILSMDTVAGRAVVTDTVEFVGNLLPSFEGSASTTVNFLRSFELYAQMDWKSDFYIFNSTAEFRERQFGTGENWIRRNEILSAEERITRFGPFVDEDGANVAAGNVNIAYIEPADFVRLREVSLSYSVPRSFAQRFLRATGATITAGARNLKLWTDYTGADPEVNTSTSGTTRQEFLTVPAPKRFVLRASLSY